MHSISHLRALLLLGLLGAAQSACIETEDEAVFVPVAGLAPAQSAGCASPEPQAGRLRGLVYTLPLETRKLPDFSARNPFGAICLDRLSVTERRGAPGFPGLRDRFEWFGIDFQGLFLVGEPGTFRFRLTSDDGSRLLIDGAPIIENDGYHPVRVAEGVVALGSGPHTIAVPFWQGPGPLALVLEVARPGEPYRIFRMDLPLRGSGQ